MQKPNLILDLDETLVSCCHKRTDNYLYKGSYTINRIEYHINFRPNVEQFIDTMAEIYNLYIYSNGMQPYVNETMKLFRNYYKFKFIKGRSSPFETLDKDMKKIGLDPSNTIILDDRPFTWIESQQKNVISIPQFVVSEYVTTNVNSLELVEPILKTIYCKYMCSACQNISDCI
jgi:TFIIF-interacting CTD phosphatase-like protein